MIEIRMDIARRQVGVFGHHKDMRICGALTMLMRAASMLASRSKMEDGISVVEIAEEYAHDFESLRYGLESIAGHPTTPRVILNYVNSQELL